MEHNPLICLSEADNVAVARREIAAGTALTVGQWHIVTRELIPSGHKVALRAIDNGKVVRKCPGHRHGNASH